MQSITVPSLILQGREDRIVLPASSDNIARHVSHVSLVDYDHCGHVPFVEVAEQFNRDTAALRR
jgi:non-heme chloroperoxidase